MSGLDRYVGDALSGAPPHPIAHTLELHARTGYVQDAGCGSKIGAADQSVGGRPTARVNDPFAQHSEERIRIELINLSIAERTRATGADLCGAHGSSPLETGDVVRARKKVGDLG